MQFVLDKRSVSLMQESFYLPSSSSSHKNTFECTTYIPISYLHIWQCLISWFFPSLCFGCRVVDLSFVCLLKCPSVNIEQLLNYGTIEVRVSVMVMPNLDHIIAKCDSQRSGS